MEAKSLQLLDFLKGDIQFQVPIYQRRYEWEEKECKRLWKDLLRVGKDEDTESYFLGSIVCMNPNPESHPSEITEYLIIDGQQRLATLALLIAALGKAIEDRSVEIGTTQERLKNSYLFNVYETGEYRHKQILTEHDKETLIRLLEGRETPDNQSIKLLNNYEFFKEELQPDNLEVVYKGLHKLTITSITLKAGLDHPQLIFESINSTGKDLEAVDLMRNYILMGQTPDLQKRLYEEYWRPMEQRFGADYTDPLRLFITDYIMLKTQEPVIKKDDVYEEFKRQVLAKDEDTLEESIKEICRYSKYYVRFALLEEDDRELRERFESFDAFQITIVFPLLLSLYEDYMEGLIQKTEFIEVLRLIENYIVRRIICAKSTKHMRKVFLALISKINKSNYIESLKEAFAELTSQARYYSDTDFKEHFCNDEVYNQRGCNYLLYRLENYARPKEQIPLKDCSKERIMPQATARVDEWKEELGKNWEEVYNKYLNTIGNLTLTGYNPELGIRSFKDKKDILRKSRLSLNQDIIRVERWDETAIINRANNLSEKALKIWPDHGKVIQETGEQQKKDWTLADHPHLTGETMELFKQLRRGVRQLDDSISERIRKPYIAYGMNPTLVTVYPRTKRLRLLLNLPFSDINDPRQECTDLTNRNHHQLGNVEVGVSSVDELDYTMFLIRQVFEKQSERL